VTWFCAETEKEKASHDIKASNIFFIPVLVIKVNYSCPVFIYLDNAFLHLKIIDKQQY
jgi:hypothetical protein